MSEQNFAPKSNDPITPPENIKEALVGPEAKYKTEEDALKALFHSQEHIKRLEAEAAQREAEYQSKLAGAKTVEEVLAAIDAKKEIQPPATPPTEGFTPPAEPTAPEAPKREDLEELIQRALEEKTSQQTASQNFNRAVTALDSKFGSRDATNAAVAKRAADLGVGITFLKEMAETSPDGFLKVMDAAPSNPPKTEPISNGLNTSSLVKNNPGGPPPAGTYRWYQDLKKSDPRQYRQLYAKQMEDMSSDPDKFYERV